MTDFTVSEARANFYRLVDDSAHKPVRITGKRSNAVLVSEDDWNAIQETLHLLSIPGMRESIRKGLKAPVKGLARKLTW